jgi:hypothetical protein
VAVQRQEIGLALGGAPGLGHPHAEAGLTRRREQPLECQPDRGIERDERAVGVVGSGRERLRARRREAPLQRFPGFARPPNGRRADPIGAHQAALALIIVGVVDQARTRQGVGEVEPRGLFDPELLSQQAALVVGEGTLDVARDVLVVATGIQRAGIRRGRGRPHLAELRRGDRLGGARLRDGKRRGHACGHLRHGPGGVAERQKNGQDERAEVAPELRRVHRVLALECGRWA